MKKNTLYKINVIIVLFVVNFLFSQETLPVYQDYLSDNIYLIHPAAAGVGSCNKIRVTARTQWANIKDAPQLQTASFHGKIDNENSRTGFGAIIFNDKNGYHSQKGLKGTYSYHIPFNEGGEFEQLSFGLSLSAIYNQIDQRGFALNDPTINPIVESNMYFNSDFGIAYHKGGISSYLTIKNLFISPKSPLKSEGEALDMRNFILGFSYFFSNKEGIQFEPSVLLQIKGKSGKKLADLNLKAYKNIQDVQLWGGISYRTSIGSKGLENAQYISPIIGFNYRKFMVSYTYTKQMNSIMINQGEFHQFSLGLDLMCAKRRSSACPNINGAFY